MNRKKKSRSEADPPYPQMSGERIQQYPADKGLDRLNRIQSRSEAAPPCQHIFVRGERILMGVMTPARESEASREELRDLKDLTIHDAQGYLAHKKEPPPLGPP